MDRTAESKPYQTWATVMPRFMNTDTGMRFEKKWQTQTGAGKVAIIGAEETGLALARHLAQNKLCRELALVDLPNGSLRQKMSDLQYACALDNPAIRITVEASYPIIQDAQIVVFTLNDPQHMMRDMAEATVHVRRYAPQAIFLIMPTPSLGNLEILCQVARTAIDMPEERASMKNAVK